MAAAKDRSRQRAAARSSAAAAAAWGTMALVAVAVLAGCASGPDYVPPEVATPATFRQAPPPGWKEAQATDRLPRGPWWRMYGDSTLDALAEQAIAANQTVQASEAAVRQARAQLWQAGAARYPVLSGGFNASRASGSSAGFSGGSDGFGGTVSSESWRAALDASWEIDLWGRVRRSVEAGEADLQAADADLENVRLTVIADLARNYFDLRVLDAQRQLLSDTVAAYERSLQLTRNRYQSGVVPRVDVVQAEVQWKSTQAQLVDTGIARAALESAIAVLVGRPASSFQIDAVRVGTQRPRLDQPPPADSAGGAAPLALAHYPGIPEVPVLPAGLPSELLQRRPDIAAAERSVAASSARIGVAAATLYPSVSLSASAGLRESAFSQLLRSPLWFWSPALSVLQVLFDAGERKAITEQARAVYEGQVASYRQAVLQSFKEVEDNLAALRILDEEIRLQEETLAAARLALQLVTNQYQGGVVNFLNVLVALIKALGGGWEAPPAGAIAGAAAAAPPSTTTPTAR